jgi:hypothetical protein
MQDEKKKKKELIDELNRLRRRIARFEGLRDKSRRVRKRQMKTIEALQSEMASVKILKGLLPICSGCKNIRDDKGYWNQLEVYIRDHSEAEFTHGLCPECIHKLYPVDILRRIQPE